MRALLLACTIAAFASPALAGQTRFYGYVAESETARSLTGDLTLVFDDGLFADRPERLHLSGGRVVELDRAGALGDRVGDVPLSRLVPDAPELYAYPVTAGKDAGLAAVACEGDASALSVALSRPKRNRPLTLALIGRDASGAPTLCAALTYRYRGEWSAPSSRRGSPESDGVRDPRR